MNEKDLQYFKIIGQIHAGISSSKNYSEDGRPRCFSFFSRN